MLPIYFLFFVGAGMSAGPVTATLGQGMLLGLAPLVSASLCAVIFHYGKVTTGQSVAAFLAALLSYAELAFALWFWIV
jgi:hypothetical protein